MLQHAAQARLGDAPFIFHIIVARLPSLDKWQKQEIICGVQL
jgi:hypothetical protein